MENVMQDNAYLKEEFVRQGFSFTTDNNGYEVPVASGSIETEYYAVRDRIGMTDLTYVNIYRISGDDAVDYLDYVVCGDIGRLREEDVLHSCIIDNQATIISDIYVANNEEEFFLLADGGDYEKLHAVLHENSAKFEVDIASLNHDFALLSIDGPYSWVPLKNRYSSQILGISYLTFMQLEDEADTFVFRTGKTGEYGFWIMLRKEKVDGLYNALKQASEDYKLQLYGRSVSNLFKLENRFIDYGETKYIKNPYELGLFWMIYNDKEMHTGDVLQNIVKDGIAQWATGFTTESTPDSFNIGDRIRYRETDIGTVINKGYSYMRHSTIGVGLIDKDYAHSNLRYAIEDKIIETVPTPFILNKSLSVKME